MFLFNNFCPVDPEYFRGRFDVVTRYARKLKFGSKYKGSLITKGFGRFPDGMEIKVDVSARDIMGDKSQLSIISIFVLVGLRPPQFFQETYYGYIFENTPPSNT